MKINFIFLFLLLLSPAVSGCDICGCFMGITPYDNQSNIAVFYRMRSYNGYYYQNQSHEIFPSGSMRISHGGMDTSAGSINHPLSQDDYEEYRVIEWRAKYFIHQRIELNVIIPYLFNSSLANKIKTEVSGIGDANFIAGYHILKRIQTGNWQNRLIAGAGIKLPTGSSKRKNNSGERYDLLQQTGTGTTDYFGYFNYIIAYRKLGASLNVTYKINGENKYNESAANSFTSNLNLFYKLKTGTAFSIIPSVQGYYEQTKGVSVNGELQDGTSMEVTLMGPGIELYYKKISLHGVFQLPVYERKEAHRIGSAGRLIIGLTYNFNQRNYLFQKNNK